MWSQTGGKGLREGRERSHRERNKVKKTKKDRRENLGAFVLAFNTVFQVGWCSF